MSVCYSLHISQGQFKVNSVLYYSKYSPSSPSKPAVVAPLSPRMDRRLSVRRPTGQRSKRSSLPVDSESDESHSLLGEHLSLCVSIDIDTSCELKAVVSSSHI